MMRAVSWTAVLLARILMGPALEARAAAADEARRVIEAQYARINDAIGKQDVEGIARRLASDFTLTGDGETVTRAQYKAMVRQGFQVTHDLTASTAIETFALKGNKAVAVVTETQKGKAKAPDGKERAVTIVMKLRDTWMRSANGWLLQRSEGLSSQPTVESKPNPAARPEGGDRPMTRDEAVSTIQTFFRAYGINSSGLNRNNLGGAMVGEGQVYFEYQPERQALKCGALIYRFHDEPKPGLLAGFRQEETAGTADTGGGTVDYEPENKGLYLSRTYTRTVPEAAFHKDMERLMKASLVWSDTVVGRVATRVFHKEPPAPSSQGRPGGR